MLYFKVTKDSYLTPWAKVIAKLIHPSPDMLVCKVLLENKYPKSEFRVVTKCVVLGPDHERPVFNTQS